MVGSLGGLAIAGKLMIWWGCFQPGVTPSFTILDYWPGFLTGGILGGTACSWGARMLWSWWQD